MRWWTKGLILSVIWLVVVVATGYVHTEVFLAGQTTQAQDEALSEAYGMASGFGLAVLWVVCFFGLRRPSV
jgi:tryptophan-rich sensory protein